MIEEMTKETDYIYKEHNRASRKVRLHAGEMPFAIIKLSRGQAKPTMGWNGLNVLSDSIKIECMTSSKI